MRKGSRASGTNPRALGTNPKATVRSPPYRAWIAKQGVQQRWAIRKRLEKATPK